MVITSGFVAFGAVVAVALTVILRATKAHKEQEMTLTADELKSFNERFRFSRDRTDIPTKFEPIRATSDRLRRRALLGTFAVIAGIAILIIRGPHL